MVGENTGWFEVSQTLTLRNIALSDAARDQRIVVAAISGPYFPKDRYDQTMETELGSQVEQLAYLGIYYVREMAPEYSKRNEDDLMRIVQLHKARFPGLDSHLLRAAHRNRRRYKFVPFDMTSMLESENFRMKYVLASNDDPRRLKYHLDDGVDLTDAMDCVGKNCVFYHKAVDRFFDNRDYEHFFKRYEIPGNDGNATSNSSRGKSVQDLSRNATCIDPAQVWNHTEVDQVPRGVQYASGRLGFFHVRTSDIKKNQSRMLMCSLANFARCLEMNVDPVHKTIGQLVDPTNRDSLHARAVYDQVFGRIGTLGSCRYLSLLGPELQKSPISHPTRLYDPNRAILFESLGGTKGFKSRARAHYFRDSAKDFDDLLFQSFVVESIPAGSVYVNWTRLFRKLHPLNCGDTTPTVLVPSIENAI